MKTTMKFFMLLGIVFLFTISCKQTKDITNTTVTSKSNSTLASPHPSKICFLVFSIYTDSVTDQNHITLINKSESIGKIKPTDESRINSESYLTFKLYENDQLIHTIIKPHPLYKDIEYISDNNSLITKHIKLEKEDFFIRLQVNNPSTLKIFEKRKDKSETTLSTVDV